MIEVNSTDLTYQSVCVTGLGEYCCICGKEGGTEYVVVPD